MSSLKILLFKKIYGRNYFTGKTILKLIGYTSSVQCVYMRLNTHYVTLNSCQSLPIIS
jgi:hypothetical protein